MTAMFWSSYIISVGDSKPTLSSTLLLLYCVLGGGGGWEGGAAMMSNIETHAHVIQWDTAGEERRRRRRYE